VSSSSRSFSPDAFGAEVLLLSAEQARTADGRAIAAGVAPVTLMARAAGHLARTVIAAGGRAYGLRVDVIVGTGDNGGDGWAAATLMAERGVQVRVIAPHGLEAATGPAHAAARGRWIAARGTVLVPHAQNETTITELLIAPSGRAVADVVVDCLLGTGAVGPLRPLVRAATGAIQRARAAGAVVVACDLPTGVSADDGAVAEGAVHADVTVTFGALKRGLLLAPGSAQVGRLVLGRLGEAFLPGPSLWSALSAAGAVPVAFEPEADKRTRGTVLVIAGRTGAGGAAALAGMGALAAGAGLVTVAVPEPVRDEVAAQHPALMVIGLPARPDGSMHPDAVHVLDTHGIDGRPGGADVVVAGPGLGVGAGTDIVMKHLRAQARRLVLDADALNVHRGALGRLADHAGLLVITPHARELDRLAGPGTYDGRVTRVPAIAQELDAIVVAKGPGTLVADPSGAVRVTPLGTSALATGGTGDVLAGMIGAVIASQAHRRAPDTVGAPVVVQPHVSEHAVDADMDDVSGPAPIERPDPETMRVMARAVAQATWWHAAAGIIAGARCADRPSALEVMRAVPEVLARLQRLERLVDTGEAGAVECGALLGIVPGLAAPDPVRGADDRDRRSARGPRA
jgi:ADP-dependent NAD(P)H-hydrate dehydratase / NAD(P)H-hydrate epimerase